MPIHLDEEIAKSVGLPGIIIHGLCTMAFTSWAAIQELADGDPTRLRGSRCASRSRCCPGRRSRRRFWDAGERDGAPVYAFETTNADGDVVIKDGVAEIG